MSITPFIKYFIEESLKKRSLAELYDADINKACSELASTPINIIPRAINPEQPFTYQQPQTLNVYPARSDCEEYLLKAEQLNQAMHNISAQIVFEIKGSKKQGIVCDFFAEKTDIAVIEAGIRNYYPNSFTETIKETYLSGKYYIYDFIPDAPFYKTLTSFNSFTISPLNIIPQLLMKIDNGIGVCQVLVTPLPGSCHELVKQAIDIEWQSSQESTNRVTPSLQSDGKKLEYKAADFRHYYAACIRLILPADSLETSVRAFIANYTYGGNGFKILDNQHYSQPQIIEMLNNRISYHTGFLVNSYELTSLLHIPFQVLNDKTFDGIFASAPVGDRPIKTAKYKDIIIGKWACGNSSKEIHLPIQKEITNVHVMGVPRSGKSILLGHIAIEKFKRGEAIVLLDPHGDLVDNTLKMVPRNLMHKVTFIDFGLDDLTPQITIRANVDVRNPSKVSDDLTESIRDSSGSREKFWGPRMAYTFQCLFFIYSVIPELSLPDIRRLVSRSAKAKALRTKIKAQITHPIVKDFLDELEFTSQEILMPVITRLAHLLIDEKSLRLFTLEKNRISINDIMENGKLLLVNLSCGILGRQRSSILSGLIDSLVSNNAFARASIPYEKRKPCTIIKDEFYMGTGDLDTQLTQLAKYNLSTIFAHQYIDQVEGKTKEVMATAGTRIMFKLRRQDAVTIGRDFGIEPEEFTSLRKFQAIVKIEDEVVKINSPKPVFPEKDYSKQIIQNCFKRYYLRHNDIKETRQKRELSFDKL